MDKKDIEKQDVGKIVLQELTGGDPQVKKKKSSFWKTIEIPMLAIFTGLIIGAIMIAATSETVYAAFGQSIWKGFVTAFSEIGTA